MRLRFLIVGLVIGIILGAGAMWIYGKQVRDNVADATKEIGAEVKDVGEKLEKTGKKIR